MLYKKNILTIAIFVMAIYCVVFLRVSIMGGIFDSAFFTYTEIDIFGRNSNGVSFGLISIIRSYHYLSTAQAIIIVLVEILTQIAFFFLIFYSMSMIAAKSLLILKGKDFSFKSANDMIKINATKLVKRGVIAYLIVMLPLFFRIVISFPFVAHGWLEIDNISPFLQQSRSLFTLLNFSGLLFNFTHFDRLLIGLTYIFIIIISLAVSIILPYIISHSLCKINNDRNFIGQSLRFAERTIGALAKLFLLYFGLFAIVSIFIGPPDSAWPFVTCTLFGVMEAILLNVFLIFTNAMPFFLITTMTAIFFKHENYEDNDISLLTKIEKDASSAFKKGKQIEKDFDC